MGWVAAAVGPAGVVGVEAAGIALHPAAGPGVEDLRRSAGGFVAGGEEKIGRVIAVGFLHAAGFVLEDSLWRIAGQGEIVPHAAFGLNVKAQFVRGDEGFFWWAEGMEADGVEAIVFAGLDDFLPVGDVAWRIAGEGASPPLWVPRTPISWPLRTMRLLTALISRRPKVRSRWSSAAAAGEFDGQVLEVGMEFIPELGGVAERERDFGFAAFLVPCDGVGGCAAVRCAGAGWPDLVADGDFDAGGFIDDVREDLCVFDPDGGCRGEFDSSDDSVPGLQPSWSETLCAS